MKASISKSTIDGHVLAPSSKSYTIRGLVCAALAGGQSELLSPLGSDDTDACWRVLEQLGVKLVESPLGWTVDAGELKCPDAPLYCRESAATLRFITAIASLVPGTTILTAAPSLARRPVTLLLDALGQLGVECSLRPDDGAVIVHGGSLKGGTVRIPGDISSQYISALLFIGPFSENGMAIHVTTPLDSRDYVRMTLDTLDAFGIEVEHTGDMRELIIDGQHYEPAEYTVEGDWSSASYLLALGALTGSMTIGNLSIESSQGDKAIVEILRDMGADIAIENDTLSVVQSELRAVKADLNNCIDLLPTVAVLAAVADGTTELTGIKRARLKESDRISSVVKGLESMGIEVSAEEDSMMIKGGTPRGAVIDSNNDHRIAMAFSLLGTVVGDTVIEDAGCVSKTWPEYWEVLKNSGGEVTLDGQ